MRKALIIITLTSIGITHLSLGQTKQKVLFIGNSFVYVNDLPTMLANITSSMGDTLVRDQSTPGGYSLLNHTTNSNTTGKIQQGNWDCVVLQEGIGVFLNNSKNYNLAPALQLDQLIKNYNANCNTLVYLPWGRKYGCCSAIPCDESSYSRECTYQGQDSIIRRWSLIIADTLKASISPVGIVWNYLIKNNPTLELYNPDMAHPSVAGTYAAACCFYTLLYKKDPTKISFINTLNTSVADTIKRAVKLLVYDNLAEWTTAINEIGEYSANDIALYPQPANDCITIEAKTAINEIVVYSIIGKRIMWLKPKFNKSLTIIINNLKTGIYVIQVKQANGRVSVVKMVKK